jgi:hypothetical protein
MIEKRIEGHVEVSQIPDFAAINPPWPRHAAIGHHFIELGRPDSDVYRGLYPR